MENQHAIREKTNHCSADFFKLDFGISDRLQFYQTVKNTAAREGCILPFSMNKKTQGIEVYVASVNSALRAENCNISETNACVNE